MTLPEDIERYVRAHFPPHEVVTVFELLRGAVLHDGTAPSARLLRCALIGSKGTLDGLRYQVKEITIDYRDVIVSGEYDTNGPEWVQVRDLSKPFPHSDECGS